MLQSCFKSNDKYLKRFKLNIITLKLAGGEHCLYDKKLYQKVMNIGNITPSKDEK